mmetsp:Transcript_115912/g.332863  ORF Transcript_115912/g.332863 Transcript_115912/m.332863 type:complete len:242 (+) Transcript_115912:320-1045(+)
MEVSLGCHRRLQTRRGEEGHAALVEKGAVVHKLRGFVFAVIHIHILEKILVVDDLRGEAFRFRHDHKGRRHGVGAILGEREFQLDGRPLSEDQGSMLRHEAAALSGVLDQPAQVRPETLHISRLPFDDAAIWGMSPRLVHHTLKHREAGGRLGEVDEREAHVRVAAFVPWHVDEVVVPPSREAPQLVHHVLRCVLPRHVPDHHRGRPISAMIRRAEHFANAVGCSSAFGWQGGLVRGDALA